MLQVNRSETVGYNCEQSPVESGCTTFSRYEITFTPNHSYYPFQLNWSRRDIASGFNRGKRNDVEFGQLHRESE